MTFTRWYAFDTETGGLSPWEHPLLSVGSAHFKDGEVTSTSEFLVVPDPTKSISPKALEINNIDVALAEAEGMPHADAGKRMVASFEEKKNAGIPIVGHNMTFDITYAMVNAGLGGAELGSEYLFFDTKLLVRHLRPQDSDKHLGQLCDLFGIDLTDAHNAAADAVATGLLFGALLREYPEIESWTADELREIMSSEFDAQVEGHVNWTSFDRFGSATSMSRAL